VSRADIQYSPENAIHSHSVYPLPLHVPDPDGPMYKRITWLVRIGSTPSASQPVANTRGRHTSRLGPVFHFVALNHAAIDAIRARWDDKPWAGLPQNNRVDGQNVRERERERERASPL